jgi:peroxiredoxin
MLSHRSWVSLLCVAVSACNRSPEAPPAAKVEPSAHVEPARVAEGVVGKAEIGKPAPDFTLTDLDGRPFKLSDNKGKLVVLEWFNPECPFVNLTHTKGSLKGLAHAEAARGVVWVGINSAAPGKQGYGKEANKAGLARFGLDQPVLLDETGKVGHAYGAAHTPHLFVIDTSGVLAYAGAIDNSPDGEGESPTGGQLVNYVEQALDALRAGKPVPTPSTEAYGCSVKYGA